MVTELTEKIKSSLKDAAKKLTGFKKRAFMAQVTIDYFNSSPRRAETELGWSRQAIATGLKELETGIICVDNYRARGRKKTEELLPNLEADIKSLVEMYSQADPKFQGSSLSFMLNQQTRCQDNILLTQKFRKFLKP
ncbi:MULTISPECIES: hypothetical protein [Microcystis]|uniref:Uncharacterized protein n=1 Tax=Microcystis viridis NIES-102 TaxID=213615 RepID=A0A3G9K8N1_MICVR|nr:MULTISPECIES: hypothetical protein [Microcystis]BBH42830.1 hypothetical protein myaer102_55010 [Microcystis viridis NIES-102]